MTADGASDLLSYKFLWMAGRQRRKGESVLDSHEQLLSTVIVEKRARRYAKTVRSNWLPGRGGGSMFLDCTFSEDMA